MTPDSLEQRSSEPPLSDGVVTLRISDERDLAAIEAGIHDPDVVRWFGRPTDGAVEVLRVNEQRGLDGSPTLSVCLGDDACLGLVWMNRSQRDPRVGAIGYWLLPAARGGGIATRAVRLITAWSVQALGIVELRILADPANDASRRVAEHSGFLLTRYLAAYHLIDGRTVDQVEYSLHPAEGHAGPDPVGPR